MLTNPNLIFLGYTLGSWAALLFLWLLLEHFIAAKSGRTDDAGKDEVVPFPGKYVLTLVTLVSAIIGKAATGKSPFILENLLDPIVLAIMTFIFQFVSEQIKKRKASK